MPRISAVPGPIVGRLLCHWLMRPRLVKATLISFAWDPDLTTSVALDQPSDMLLSILERASQSADITIVLSSEAALSTGRRGERIRTWIERLDRSGIRVLKHDTLHAKVYVLEEDARGCWIVGSSNMSAGGLENNEEVNLRGYHPADLQEVRQAAAHLVAQARYYWE